MHALKRVFCRVYQAAFRAALPVLPYREPQILNAIEDIAEENCKNKLESAMLVTDAFLKKSGATLLLEEALERRALVWLCMIRREQIRRLKM